MGVYFNPNNGSFTCDKNSRIYVDKTGLLDITNQAIDTDAAFIKINAEYPFLCR